MTSSIKSRSDYGESTVQYVLLVPVVLLVLIVAIQLTTYFHAATIAAHAATRGAGAASRAGRTNVDGLAEAQRVVVESGAEFIDGSVAGDSEIEARIKVRVIRLVPFFPSSVSRRAVVPKERVVLEAER